MSEISFDLTSDNWNTLFEKLSFREIVQNGALQNIPFWNTPFSNEIFQNRSKQSNQKLKRIIFTLSGHCEVLVSSRPSVLRQFSLSQWLDCSPLLLICPFFFIWGKVKLTFQHIQKLGLLSYSDWGFTFPFFKKELEKEKLYFSQHFTVTNCWITLRSKSF